jgi:hypothetical protein
LQVPQLQLAHSHVAQSQASRGDCSPEAEHAVMHVLAPDG